MSGGGGGGLYACIKNYTGKWVKKGGGVLGSKYMAI